MQSIVPEPIRAEWFQFESRRDMHTLVVLILPALVSAQWGTPPPIVTDEQCKDELLKIRGCVTVGFELFEG